MWAAGPWETATLTQSRNICYREQYLFNVFEVIVSTLETKLQRIENLDKAVEHLMRRVEALDSRINDNIDKTESVINKLRSMEERLSSHRGRGASDSDVNLDTRLVSLDKKVSDIGSKLANLKSQLDSNFLPADDINAEASEKKPISMNVVDIGKVLSAEMSRELQALRTTTGNVDRKLQFHMNLVSENLGKMLGLVTDVHDAVFETAPVSRNRSATTEAPPPAKSSKLDRLAREILPIVSVSEKMDEVWDVVVGTKTSVDDLLPKSDELLTQTQRQERAINDVHADLRQKANKIIANLDLVEKRLKRQEDEVVSLAQRPVAAELLLDPTIDRLVEYDPNRYSVVTATASSASNSVNGSGDLLPETDPLPGLAASPSLPPPVTVTPSGTSSNSGSNGNGSTTRAPPRASSRGVIFPSVKNKPSVANSTFTAELFSIKDVKVIIEDGDFFSTDLRDKVSFTKPSGLTPNKRI